MRAELRASLEELTGDYSRQVGRLTEMRRALDEVSATATCRDGLATVVADPRGQVQDIRFGPKIDRRLTPSEPSRPITPHGQVLNGWQVDPVELRNRAPGLNDRARARHVIKKAPITRSVCRCSAA